MEYSLGRIKPVVLGVMVGLVFSLGPLPVGAASSVTSNSTCAPDFAITVSPTSITIVKGGPTMSIGVGFTSLCGLSGTINFGVRGITPKSTTTCNDKGVCTSNGLVFKQCCYDLPLKSGGSTGNRIIVNATKNTLATTYQVKITGTNIQGGCCYGITHSANVTITVAACCFPSFTVSANPTVLSAPLGQPVLSTITATGSGGFSGTIYYMVAISPNPPAVGSDACFNPQPTAVTLLSPTVVSATSQYSCTITPKGTYTITITATPSTGGTTRTISISVKVT